MRELFYNALDVAVIISAMELNCRDESHLIDSIWDGEKVFLYPEYRRNQKKFILDVRYWLITFMKNQFWTKNFQQYRRIPQIQKVLLTKKVM